MSFSPVLVQSVMVVDGSAPAAPGIGDPAHMDGPNIVGDVVWPSTDAGPNSPTLTGLVEGFISWFDATDPSIDPYTMTWEQIRDIPQVAANMTKYPLTPDSAGKHQSFSFPATTGSPTYVVAAARD